MTQIIGHWIDGKRQDGQSGRHGSVFNPATGKETARVAFASAEEVDRAVASASAAFPEWRDSTITTRARIMFRTREALDEAKDERAEILASETGKTGPESRGEVRRGFEPGG